MTPYYIPLLWLTGGPPPESVCASHRMWLLCAVCITTCGETSLHWLHLTLEVCNYHPSTVQGHTVLWGLYNNGSGLGFLKASYRGLRSLCAVKVRGKVGICTIYTVVQCVCLELWQLGRPIGHFSVQYLFLGYCYTLVINALIRIPISFSFQDIKSTPLLVWWGKGAKRNQVIIYSTSLSTLLRIITYWKM